ncbi:MAG: hypothetical protein H7333_07950, partial [Bdellovibrionales bacterium]|nr:hypothetical protein [Oligoflexia bacterium]
AMTVRSTTNSIFDQMTLTDTGSGGTASCGVEGGNGLYIRNGSGLSFTNLKVVSNLGSGIRLNAPGLTSLKNVQVINNGLLSAYTGRAGIRETGIATGVVTYQNVIATNNAGEGLSIGYTGSVLSEILSTHNGSSGITINAAATSVTAATLAYNGAYGVNQSFKDAATTYHDLVAYKNTLAGIYFFDEAVGATLSQVVSQNNGGAGIQMAPPSVSGTARIKLVGNILVGANTGASCSIPAGTIGIADSSCTPNGTSTAVVKTNLAITGSFIEGTSSTQAFASITDFSNAAYSGKAWGRASPLTSACITGENCQLFDWALKSSDTVLMNKTGDAMTPNESFTAFGVCPVQTYGTVTDTKFTGSTAFLRNAIEDILVAGGNHNGLCETGETCIYTPNFGYYQGEGTYSPCAYQADGGINGVYLSGYSSNGH